MFLLTRSPFRVLDTETREERAAGVKGGEGVGKTGVVEGGGGERTSNRVSQEKKTHVRAGEHVTGNSELSSTLGHDFCLAIA